jgi:hypothetical protein
MVVYDMKLLQELYVVKSLQAISCLKIVFAPNFSETISVAIIRVDVMMT